MFQRRPQNEIHAEKGGFSFHAFPSKDGREKKRIGPTCSTLPEDFRLAPSRRIPLFFPFAFGILPFQERHRKPYQNRKAKEKKRLRLVDVLRDGFDARQRIQPSSISAFRSSRSRSRTSFLLVESIPSLGSCTFQLPVLANARSGMHASKDRETLVHASIPILLHVCVTTHAS